MISGERGIELYLQVGTLLAEHVCHDVWWCSCRLENHTSEQSPGTATLSSYKTDQFCLLCVGICLWFWSLPIVNCWSCCCVPILFWLSWQQNYPKDTELHSLPAHQPQLMMSCGTVWARHNCSREVAHSWLLQLFSHLVTWVFDLANVQFQSYSWIEALKKAKQSRCKQRCEWYKRIFFLEKMGTSHHITSEKILKLPYLDDSMTASKFQHVAKI